MTIFFSSFYSLLTLDFVIQFLGALQHSVLHASLETMTCIAYSAPSGLVASVIVKRTQHFKYIIVIGWALLAIGMGTNVRCFSSEVLYFQR